MEFNKEILEYYGLGKEAKRLDGISLEKLRTQELITRHIQNPPAKVLDVGGASGVYSFWLSQKGYEVHLVDIVPDHIEQANAFSKESQIKLVSANIGDARELNFKDCSFDVVLLLGPLYHLTEKEDRIKALKEAKRVLKQGGIVFCAAISRFASLLDGFHQGLVADTQFVSMMNQDLYNGQHRNKTKNQGYFTTAYLHHPDELKEEITNSGFALEGLFAIESFAQFIPEVERKCENKEYLELLLGTLRKIECDASLIGVSSHILGVGKNTVK